MEELRHSGCHYYEQKFCGGRKVRQAKLGDNLYLFLQTQDNDSNAGSAKLYLIRDLDATTSIKYFWDASSVYDSRCTHDFNCKILDSDGSQFVFKIDPEISCSRTEYTKNETILAYFLWNELLEIRRRFVPDE